MERFARLVASTLRVPVALVSLVEADRQVFPGMVGLAEPWAATRQTPLSHSLCQHVAASGSPLVLPDARLDERTCTSLAIGDLGVVAYAGMPLTDADGHVLGSLCAIDQRPRVWTEQELADLADLAAACSGELRLRIMTYHARQAQESAERAGHEARSAAAQTTVALRRSQLMLQAAADLAGTTGLNDVRRSVRNLVCSDLAPAYVGLVLVHGQELRRVVDPDFSHVTEVRSPAFPLDSPLPSARAVRDGEMVVVSDRGEVAAGYGGAVAEFDAADLQSAVCVPLPGPERTLGALILAWAMPHQVDLTERAVLTAIAGYTARAVERALLVDERVTVARELQRAMLTDLPDIPGLQLAAAYRAASASELVGGDWYDAYQLPNQSDGPGQGPAGSVLPVAVTVGDITGHDIRSAAIMGQVRSMLRQAALVDHLGPAGAVTAVEKACQELALNASGTLVHGHLRPTGAADWQLTWTSAGHPPLLLALQDGATELLEGADMLLWPGADNGRIDHQHVLVSGDTLLLYTDGLVEHRTYGMDTGRVAATMSAAPPGQPLPELLGQLLNATGSDTADDIAVLAVRIPPARRA